MFDVLANSRIQNVDSICVSIITNITTIIIAGNYYIMVINALVNFNYWIAQCNAFLDYVDGYISQPATVAGLLLL